ncbi:hypothetical protein HID58_086185, partial [Brassica napus]
IHLVNQQNFFWTQEKLEHSANGLFHSIFRPFFCIEWNILILSRLWHCRVSSAKLSTGVEDDKKHEAFVFPKFVVMGHRGFGMNMLQSPDEKMKSIKENSILSFNVAADFPIEFVEFDVQVTRDGCPVIFHDNFIFTQEQGVIIEKRVTEMALHEFISYGPQKDGANKDKRWKNLSVESGYKDDPLCTLKDAFVVDEHAENRPIIFSSFHPDAARLIRNMQMSYPNSLDEAIKICKEGGLQGIVSEAKAILRTPSAITRVKDSKLSLISYGQLNNVVEVVYLQNLLGVEGVIVDMVLEISEAIANIEVRNEEDDEEDNGRKCQIMFGEESKKVSISSNGGIAFLTNLVPKTT